MNVRYYYNHESADGMFKINDLILYVLYLDYLDRKMVKILVLLHIFAFMTIEILRPLLDNLFFFILIYRFCIQAHNSLVHEEGIHMLGEVGIQLIISY